MPSSKAWHNQYPVKNYLRSPGRPPGSDGLVGVALCGKRDWWSGIWKEGAAGASGGLMEPGAGRFDGLVG